METHAEDFRESTLAVGKVQASPDKAVPPPGHVTIASVPDPPPNHPPQGLMDTLRALLTAHTLTFAD
uniref:Uncharacterized protein n=1 Tax=Vespula pensylvanica TaxID=30213 RepID=A0A834UHF0_VESPE|nr:hypothetical protein H0235_001443 [Vespula pensylvanica]